MLDALQSQFLTIRGQRVILDSDVARFYAVTLQQLNGQVGRHKTRFPEDFAFRLTAEEVAELAVENPNAPPGLNRSGRRPLAFTPVGAVVASTVLNSPKAIEINLQLVREIVAAAADPGFGKDVPSELADIEWRLAGKSGSPFDILRAYRKVPGSSD